MRTTVALVEARPETILEDYRRVLDLAGLADLESNPAPALVRSDAEGCPGFGNPPWQLDGITRALALEGRDRIVSVLQPGQGGSPQEDLPGRLRAKGAPAPVLLLPVPRLETGWGVRCAAALLGSLYGAVAPGPLSPEGFENLARALLKARSENPQLAAAADGILWGWGGGTLGKGFIQRNVLLAGRDPVAVDAVACRLAGLDPTRISWFRFCGEQGVGTADPQQIRIAGHDELLGDPFNGAELLGTPVRGPWSATGLRDRLWRVFRRPQLMKSYAGTPWGRLAAQYRGGTNPREDHERE